MRQSHSYLGPKVWSENKLSSSRKNQATNEAAERNRVEPPRLRGTLFRETKPFSSISPRLFWNSGGAQTCSRQDGISWGVFDKSVQHSCHIREHFLNRDINRQRWSHWNGYLACRLGLVQLESRIRAFFTTAWNITFPPVRKYTLSTNSNTF